MVCLCLQSMAEQLAENYHNTWGRKKKMELTSKGDGLHHTGHPSNTIATPENTTQNTIAMAEQH